MLAEDSRRDAVSRSQQTFLLALSKRGYARLLGDDLEWSQWFADAGVDVSHPANSPRMMADNQLMEVATAMAGQGIALASPILFARELRSGQLVAPFRDICSVARAYWLCYPTGRRLVPKVARFRDWLLQEARTDPVIASEAQRVGVEIGQLG